MSFFQAEVPPPLIGAPAESTGAVPRSRVRPCPWTTLALSLPCRLDRLALSHGCQSNWSGARLKLQLFTNGFESFSYQDSDCWRPSEHHLRKAFGVPAHRLADASTFERATSHQHETANKLRMPNGSANLRLEKGNWRHPFDRALCQSGDEKCPLAMWLSWQHDV